ncbi:Na+/H+ antiporter NhaA [Kineococcus gynurae]|uniref:Na(+)/H(+) antiporter NhaA n=1 Tax=Kineococcus gynurae TaxID=452979 RepID=A0ABV5LSM1_9ACTN
MSDVNRPAPSTAPVTRTGRVAGHLRTEKVSGVLLLLATAAALVWANVSAGSYGAAREIVLGPASLHLDLTLEAWAADGLLAIFFFVVGVELKREFVTGDLRNPRAAALPIAGAVGGMAAPALLYVLATVTLPGSPEGALGGWAIPTATDIAFALGVLAVIGRHLPSALRTFLLTLAVVDDLLAITIIAIFYAGDLSVAPLLLALLPLAAFALLVRRGTTTPLLLLPLAVLTWALVHESGVHATVAGVALGLLVPVRNGLADRFEHVWRPVSTGFALPVFALLAAGVTVGGASGFVEALRDPVALGVVLGLVVGKPVGILLATFVVSRLNGSGLTPGLRWLDLTGLTMLAGIGFTVSLLIGKLSFGETSAAGQHVTLGVLLGSLLSAILAGVVLGLRNRSYGRARVDA